MIPDFVVDEVRARADIVEIVGEQVQLKRAGREFRALCPFHSEKTPSFYVVPAKGFYKCFGCGESGDVFTFLMKRQGLNFQEAVRQIAGRVGVEIPDAGATERAEEPHRKLFEAIAFAADFFKRQLWDAPEGEKARRYLETREISREAAERFEMGYAVDGWHALREAANKHGIENDVLLEAGLIKESERAEKKEPYDRLRDRIIFPLGELGGRIVGFGGRILGKTEGAPKYLNSPETPIYHKGRMLYGLNWSKGSIRREGVALVVEGYMDYVSLAARGIENVVAGLGTAMTPEQATLLARYTSRALLLYDSDQAGVRASFKTGDALLRARIHPLVVTLPVGEDPDSVARKGGAEALASYLEGATDVLDRKLQILKERGYLEDSEGLRNTLDRLLPTLRAATDPVLRDIYVARVAELTKVRRETLERELDPSYRPSPRRSEQAPAGPGRGAVRDKEWSSEKLLLKLMIRDPARTQQAAEAIDPEDFRDPVNQQIFEALVSRALVDESGVEEVELSESATVRLAALHADPEVIEDGDRSYSEAIAGIRINGLWLKRTEIERRLRNGPPEENESLLAEMQEIKREMNRLDTDNRLGFRKSARWHDKLPKREKPAG